MLSNLFAPLAMKVAGGFVAVLVMALAVTMMRADAISEERDLLRNRLEVQQANHAVTKASLEKLERDMARMVNEGAIREQRVNQALATQQERSAVLREEAAKIIAEGVTDPCRSPQAVLQSKGL